jgi:hypothetical protein
VRLSREITERLAAIARTNRLTLNATIIGAWAIVLGEWTGTDDVVFGTVVSGRPPDLIGADRMVGLLVNTLPLRVKLSPQVPAVSMLREIQAAQVEMRNYEYSPLSQVRKWAGLSGDIALFDSIVGFENYPVDRNAGPDGSAVRITGIQAEEPTGYPIVLSAVPGDELFLKLAYREDCFDRGAIANILDRMTGLLTQLATAPELRLAALTLVNPGARDRVSRTALRPAVGRFSLCDRHGTVSAQAEAYATRDTAKASSERSTAAGKEELEKERQLAAIWADVLGVGNVKPDDDFFELGGDSILSMQICSRAAGIGLKLTPGQILRERCLRQVAAKAIREVPAPPVREKDGEAFALTPIQRFVFDLDLRHPGAYCQSILLEATHTLSVPALRAALASLLDHHGALSLRFRPRDGRMMQSYETSRLRLPFTEVEVALLCERSAVERIADLASDVVASIRLDSGPLVRLVLFTDQALGAQWVLLVVHHLAVDGLSWRILLEDLWASYEQAARGFEIHLPNPTASFRRWSDSLAEYAGSPRLFEQSSFWLAQFESAAAPLRTDFARDRDDARRANTISFTMPEEPTRSLLTLVPGGIRAALLAAFVESLASLTGGRTLLVDIEAHGRDALFDGVDVSRTVGWFTAMFPLLVSTEGSADWAERVAMIDNQLRSVPDGGIGYGVLKYISECKPSSDDQSKGKGTACERNGIVEAIAATSAMAPEVSFNYLGQFDAALKSAGAYAVAAEWNGPGLESVKLTHLIELNAMVADSVLTVSILFDETSYKASTIEDLGEQVLAALGEVVAELQPTRV